MPPRAGQYADRVGSILILGGSGFVGSRVLQLWSTDLEVVAPTHAELDVLDWAALAGYLRDSRATSVLNLVAWADVDGAEGQRGDHTGRVYQLNAELPGRLAQLCAQLDKRLVHLSTDYVFDGDNDQRPYREDDPTRPLCWYAETKLRGEQAALGAGDGVGVVRI